MTNARLIIVILSNLSVLGVAPSKTQALGTDWKAVQARIDQAHDEMSVALVECLVEVEDVFDEAAERAEFFAKETLSWSGSTAWVVDQLPWTTGDLFAVHIRFQTQKHLLEPGEVRLAVENALECYATRRIAAENRLLVDLQLDVEGFPRPQPRTQTPQEKQVPLIGDSGRVAAAGSTFTHTAREFAVEPTIMAMTSVSFRALLSRLGIGIPARVGSGLGSAVGLGTMIAFDDVIDEAIDGGLRLVDLSPRQVLAETTAQQLMHARDLLIEGSPNARSAVQYLASLEGSVGEGWAERSRCLAVSLLEEPATRTGLEKMLRAKEESRHELRQRCVLHWYLIEHLYGRGT